MMFTFYIAGCNAFFYFRNKPPCNPCLSALRESYKLCSFVVRSVGMSTGTFSDVSGKFATSTFCH